MSNNVKLLLVGTGKMAMEYAKVLSALSVPFDVIGRGSENARVFGDSFPGNKVYTGGLDHFTGNFGEYSHAIIATNVVTLFSNTKEVIEQGIKNILVEKPGGASASEIEELEESIKKYSPSLFIAYNRRFFASVLKAKEMIAKDGGITSMHFEFTEWANVIEKLECDPIEKKYLFLANSSHVVDLAFNMGGMPKEMVSFTSGSLSWHPSASVFTGSGLTEKNVLFSYHSNWQSAGRWSLEVLTNSQKFIFRPMEKLQIQKKNSVAIDFAEDVDYSVDEKYKPGLFVQVQKFMNNDHNDLCTYQEQLKHLKFYKKMSNY